MPRRAVIDETGNRYGRLTVTEQAENDSGGGTRWRGTRWRCKCDCGEQTLATGSQLRTGSKRSCGCIRAERCRVTLQKRYPKIWRDESVVSVEDLDDIVR